MQVALHDSDEESDMGDDIDLDIMVEVSKFLFYSYTGYVYTYIGNSGSGAQLFFNEWNSNFSSNEQ